jgi:hypothetical protein
MRSVGNEMRMTCTVRLETRKQLVHRAQRRLRLARYSCKIERSQAFSRSKLSRVDFATEIDQRRETTPHRVDDKLIGKRMKSGKPSRQDYQW